MTHNYNYTSKLNQQRIAKIVDMCKKQPTDVFEMGDKLNMSSDALREFMRFMMRSKLIYISDYYIRNATWTRKYSFGDKPNVDLNGYIKCTNEERAKRKLRTISDREKRTKQLNKLEKKVKKCMERPREPKIIKPDVASAWMFNSIC